MVTLTIDSSKVSLQSVRDLEKAVSRELYGNARPLKLRYVPTIQSGDSFGHGIFHNEAFFLAIKQFDLTIKGRTDKVALVQFDNTINDVKNRLGKEILDGEQLCSWMNC